jgi:two-component system, LytTR family, sensor kinase
MSRFKSFLASAGRSFWTLQIIGWVCYAALSFSAKAGEGGPATWAFFYLGVAASGVVITSALRLGYRRVWLWPMPRRALGAGGLLALATLVQMQVFVTLLPYFCDDCNFPNLFHYIWYFASMLYLLLSWSGLYFGIKSSRQLQQQKEAALKAQAMAHEAQLKMLRYQLNPHFLFNTLNAISTLVLDSRGATANGMVASLSAFLRYSLDSDPVQRVSLATEIDATNLYLSIEQLRFGERLRVRMDITPEARSALVPSLLLQPLVENAIKYAVTKSEAGGAIEIVARREGGSLVITLRDDGPGCKDFNDRPTGHGVGLSNTRERLLVLYGERQEFSIGNREPRGVEVRIRLPFESVPVEKVAPAEMVV